MLEKNRFRKQIMLKNVADDITILMINRKYIKAEKREIIRYGIEAIILNALNFLVALCIAIISQTLLHFLIFISAFIPLRVTCGGYHSKRSETCFIVSTLTYISTVIISKLISVLPMWTIAVIFLCWIIVLMLSPVENENNKLTSKERKKNKKTASILISLDSIIFTILVIKQSHFAVSILIFIALECFLMFIEIIRFKMQKNKKC